jgi:hypothetical protein
MLVIGDEILSGKTKDKNIGVLADALTMVGIDLVEVRIVGDMTSRPLSMRSMPCGPAPPTCSPPAASARRMTTSPPTASPRPLVWALMSIRAPTSCWLTFYASTGREMNAGARAHDPHSRWRRP